MQLHVGLNCVLVLDSLARLVDPLNTCPFEPRVILLLALLIPSTLARLHFALSLTRLVDPLNLPVCTDLSLRTFLIDPLNNCPFASRVTLLLVLFISSTLARWPLVLSLTPLVDSLNTYLCPSLYSPVRLCRCPQQSPACT